MLCGCTEQARAGVCPMACLRLRTTPPCRIGALAWREAGAHRWGARGGSRRRWGRRARRGAGWWAGPGCAPGRWPGPGTPAAATRPHWGSRCPPPGSSRSSGLRAGGNNAIGSRTPCYDRACHPRHEGTAPLDQDSARRTESGPSEESTKVPPGRTAPLGAMFLNSAVCGRPDPHHQRLQGADAGSKKLAKPMSCALLRRAPYAHRVCAMQGLHRLPEPSAVSA